MTPLYSDIRTKKRFRARYLRSLVNLLDRDSQVKELIAPVEADFARFLVDNLVYLDYGVIEEVYTVIHTIDRIMSSSGISLLQSIEGGERSEPLAILAQRSVVLSLLDQLKLFLKLAYGLTEAKCRAFDPKKTGAAKDNKAAVRTRGPEIIDWSEVPYVDQPPAGDQQRQEQLDAVNPASFVLTLVCFFDVSSR
jgi:cohesin loading factor subunit SCC2